MRQTLNAEAIRKICQAFETLQTTSWDEVKKAVAPRMSNRCWLALLREANLR